MASPQKMGSPCQPCCTAALCQSGSCDVTSPTLTYHTTLQYSGGGIATTYGAVPAAATGLHGGDSLKSWWSGPVATTVGTRYYALICTSGGMGYIRYVPGTWTPDTQGSLALVSCSPLLFGNVSTNNYITAP